MNRAKLDQRMTQATREVERTRKEYQDAKPADKARAWDLHQKALNRMNALVDQANKFAIRAPIFGGRDEE